MPKLDSDILEISKNYKPDLVLLGHNNILKRNTLEVFKNDKKKVALWYEDHVANYGPNWKSNLNLIEKIMILVITLLQLILVLSKQK